MTPAYPENRGAAALEDQQPPKSYFGWSPAAEAAGNHPRRCAAFVFFYVGVSERPNRVASGQIRTSVNCSTYALIGVGISPPKHQRRHNPYDDRRIGNQEQNCKQELVTNHQQPHIE